MTNLSRHACIRIYPKAMAHNLNRVRALTPKASVLAMVKANAYGHGIAAAVDGLHTADAFGVACFTEAQSVRALTNKPIVIIEGAFCQQEWLEACRQGMQCVIHHTQQLKWALASPLVDCPVWLKVNTGMNRLGFMPKAAETAYQKLHQAGYTIILTTHFANADVSVNARNQEQLTQFLALKRTLNARFGNLLFSMCNSAGICAHAQSDMGILDDISTPAFLSDTLNGEAPYGDWVRPGIMLYGGSPVLRKSAHDLGLKPAMRLEAAVIAIQKVAVGECVGYGSTWQADADTYIAIISAGYGDGYPRIATNSQIYAQGRYFPLVGRVSMDMLAVNLGTTLNNTPSIGDVVELWGAHVSVDDVAASAQTISYELLCRLTCRPVRKVSPS